MNVRGAGGGTPKVPPAKQAPVRPPAPRPPVKAPAKPANDMTKPDKAQAAGGRSAGAPKLPEPGKASAPFGTHPPPVAGGRPGASKLAAPGKANALTGAGSPPPATPAQSALSERGDRAAVKASVERVRADLQRDYPYLAKILPRSVTQKWGRELQAVRNNARVAREKNSFTRSFRREHPGLEMYSGHPDYQIGLQRIDRQNMKPGDSQAQIRGVDVLDPTIIATAARDGDPSGSVQMTVSELAQANLSVRLNNLASPGIAGANDRLDVRYILPTGEVISSDRGLITLESLRLSHAADTPTKEPQQRPDVRPTSADHSAMTAVPPEVSSTDGAAVEFVKKTREGIDQVEKWSERGMLLKGEAGVWMGRIHDETKKWNAVIGKVDQLENAELLYDASVDFAKFARVDPENSQALAKAAGAAAYDFGRLLQKTNIPIIKAVGELLESTRNFFETMRTRLNSMENLGQRHPDLAKEIELH